MAIRKALSSDHRAMAEIAAKAFVDEDLFGRFMYPFRREYPEDYILMWEWKIWTKFNDYAREYLVSTDEESGKVVAWAVWERLGGGAAVRPNPLSQRIYQLYAAKWKQLNLWLFPDKSADPAHVKAFRDSIPLTKHLWTGNRAESWYLDFLCTDPKYERKGHGKGLVNWGVEQAEKEGVCASLIATWERDGFYAKLGFEEVGRANIGPISEVRGGTVMFKEVK